MELQFEEKLGRGAFGEVFLATDALGRNVAVKFFSDETASQVEQQALAHARALARVEHPAVVRVLAVEPHPHPASGSVRLAIVMEHVDGTSLEMMRDDMSPPRARQVLLDVAAGLQAIHEAGMIHGDLHSANLMVHSKGGKLLDILYTRSLADVGTRTANQDRTQDLREMARLCRHVCERAGLKGQRLAEAFYRADAATSPAEIVREFVALFDHDQVEPVTSPAHARAQRPLAPLALELMTQVQLQQVPVSGLLPRILELSLQVGDVELAMLCERELAGYPAPRLEATLSEPEETFAHRVVQFYIAANVTINLEYFGSGQRAVEYMASQPDKFHPVRVLYPVALPTIERLERERKPDGLLVLHTTSSILPGAETPSIPIVGYANHNVLTQLLERLRTRLSVHLMRVLKSAGRIGASNHGPEPA